MSDNKTGSKAPWGGRFKEELDPLVRRYTGSLHLDRQLALYDVQGSRAHLRMLVQQRIVSPEDGDQISSGLDQVEKEINEGTFPYREELEDIHMNIERRLQEIVGVAGARIHTGRSRNDQVALDLKLFCLGIAREWQGLLLDLLSTLTGRARGLTAELFPGWTHLQSAQPISWAHYLLAFAEMSRRDYERLASYLQLHDVSPLGAGALSGSTLSLDPEQTARALGFKQSFRNSYDVVGDRDFVLELLQIASQIMIHASRLAEDFVYLSSTPVGWIELPDAMCTGSSMMPQKKNPDVLELARGKTASVLGHASALATLLKGLPSSYNRDLQQDKEHLFPAVSTTTDTLRILPVVLKGFQVRKDKVAPFLQEGFLMATDLAEYLVRQGVPFRTAHEKVGRAVAACVEQGIRLDELSGDQLRQLIPECGEDVGAVLLPSGVLRSRIHKGSTGRDSVEQQLTFWSGWLAEHAQLQRKDN